jgi:ATP-binding cassette, subfamily B, bacterial
MKTSTKQTLKIFWLHAKKYPGKIAILLIAITGFTSLAIYGPFWYKKFFDTLAQAQSYEAGKLVEIILIILLINFGSWAFYRVAEFTNNHFQPRIMMDLLNTCYNYLHKHSNNFFNNNFTGSLVRRVNRYYRAFEVVADQVYWEMGNTFIRIFFIVAVLFFYSWPLALTFLIWSFVYIIFHFWFSRYMLKFDIAKAETDTRTTGHLADTITNNFNIKLFSSRRYEASAYRRLTEKLHGLMLKIWNLTSISQAVQTLLMIALEFGVFYVAIKFWQQGVLTIGDFALIQAYIIQMFAHLWGLGRQIRRIYEALADAEEMTEILETPHEIKDVPKAGKLQASMGQINFSKVNFSYPGQNAVFRKFSLNIKPGERVALIGPSGGGKSTFVKLLLRFFDINSGKILIDDQNIAQVTQDSLRNNIGLVPQDPILFHRSLMENIRYGKSSATNEDVIKVSKLAHCHEFISKFPQGYDTYVGERGVKLSGGERQRVAIARAMLENAPILVLDEATSSLDSESEYYIQDALKKLMQGKTTIVIAHRLSTIMQMDRIIVIEEGKITEQGTHHELLKIKNGTYQKLWEIQAGGFIA